MELSQQIHEAVAAIREVTGVKPEFGIILGTGLGSLVKEIKEQKCVGYGEIPHFAESTVVGHAGQMVFGKLEGRPVVAMEGRVHLYEGHPVSQVTFPVRVMRALGAGTLIVSNACGGINLDYKRGDLVLIKDHINLMGVNPLIGPNDEKLGPRFPDMSRPYDRKLMDLAEKIAKKEKISCRRGVYAAMTGPCLETAAEYRMLKVIGADTIGMSTVPEVIVGVHAGFRILGISIVTDLCDPDHLEPASIEEIIKVANEAEPKLTKLVKKVVKQA